MHSLAPITQDYAHSSIRVAFHVGNNRQELTEAVTRAVIAACCQCLCVDNLELAVSRARYFALNFRYLLLIGNEDTLDCEPFKIPTRWNDPSPSAQRTLANRTQKLNERLVRQVGQVFDRIASADEDSQSRWLLDAQTRLRQWCECNSSEAKTILKNLQALNPKQGYAPEGGIFGLAFPKTDKTMLAPSRFEVVENPAIGLEAFSPHYFAMTTLLPREGRLLSTQTRLTFGDSPTDHKNLSISRARPQHHLYGKTSEQPWWDYPRRFKITTYEIQNMKKFSSRLESIEALCA